MSRDERKGVRQEQFLDVVSRDEAEARFRKHLKLGPLGEETVALAQCRGRVLARDVAASVDAPGFDRSNVDGFAVRACDTAGASDESPRTLKLSSEILTPGVVPQAEVAEGEVGAVGGEMAAVEVEQAVSVAVGTQAGVNAERRLEVDELRAVLSWDGLLERGRHDRVDEGIAVVGGKAWVDVRSHCGIDSWNCGILDLNPIAGSKSDGQGIPSWDVRGADSG